MSKQVDPGMLLNVARARGLRRLLESRYYLARTIWPSRREEIEAVILAELDAVAIEAQVMRDPRRRVKGTLEGA